MLIVVTKNKLRTKIVDTKSCLPKRPKIVRSSMRCVKIFIECFWKGRRDFITTTTIVVSESPRMAPSVNVNNIILNYNMGYTN